MNDRDVTRCDNISHDTYDTYLSPPCTTNIDLSGTSDQATPASIGLFEMVVATGNQLNTYTGHKTR